MPLCLPETRTCRDAPALRLFCFPYAGGGAAVFRGWQAMLPPELEVCIIELPGRGRRINEPLLHSMPAIICDLKRQLLPMLDRPFAFIGHSLGGLVAFELCHMLQNGGWPQPSCLFASACAAPQVGDVSTPIHNLPDAEFHAAIGNLGATPTEILNNKALMEFFSPIVRADFTVVETYQYVARSPLATPIFALVGDRDNLVPIERVAGWGDCTKAGFEVHVMSGDHFMLFSGLDVALGIVVEKLLRHLTPAAQPCDTDISLVAGVPPTLLG